MKIRGAQLQIYPKDVAKNLNKILSCLQQASKDGIDWVVFAELSLTGYFIGDLWNNTDFLQRCALATEQIVEECRKLRISAIFGNVIVDKQKIGEDGKPRKYDGTFICHKGSLWTHPVTQYPFISKTLMPNYGPFDDSRYFFDNRKEAIERNVSLSELLPTIELQSGVSAAVLICEDIWDHVYSVKPLEIVKNNHKFNLGVVLSASPFDHTKSKQRSDVLQSAVRRGQVPFLYVNQLACQNNGKTVYGFDGESQLLDSQGQVLFRAPPFCEGYFDFSLESRATGTQVKMLDSKFSPLIQMPQMGKCDEAFESLRFTVQEFLRQIKVDKLVVAVSGGIDSAVSAALLATLLPPENIFLLNMPTKFNSGVTQDLATELAKNLKLRFAKVSIQESFEQTVRDVEQVCFRDLHGALPDQKVKLSILNKENIQARDRGARVLAAVSSALGAGFVCNANKTELFSGWGTFYGDLIGVVSPLGDLWKFQVYDFALYLNEHYFSGGGIPEKMFSLIPSAELSEEQDIEKGLGDPFHYPYHDRLFCALQEWPVAVTSTEVVQWFDEGTLTKKIGFDGDMNKLFKTRQDFVDDLNRWWKAFSGIGISKRIQAPPIVAFSPKPFGYDYREAQGLTDI